MRYRNNQNSKIPELTNIAQLDIKNLTKIKNSRDKYLTKYLNYQSELKKILEKNEKIKSLNSRNQSEFERWRKEVETKKINPINNKKREIILKIKEHEVGFLSGLWHETVELCGIKISQKDAEQLRAHQVEYQRLSFELDRYQTKISQVSNKLDEKILATERVPQELKETTTLSINGVRMRVNFNDKIFDNLDQLLVQKISSLNQSKEAEQERLNHLKARASEKEEEVRSQMQKYRGDFSKQIKLVRECPYCGKILSKSNAHMDHIYPVAKGGQSVRSNLVFVCSRCNQKKGKLTLNNFISKNKYDVALVQKRLKKLDKDF